MQVAMQQLKVSAAVTGIQDALLKERVDEAYTQLRRLGKPLGGMEAFVCCTAAMQVVTQAATQEEPSPDILQTVLGYCERFSSAIGAPNETQNYLCGEGLVQFAVSQNQPAHLRLLLEHGASPNAWKEIIAEGDRARIDCCFHTENLLALTNRSRGYDPARLAQTEGFLECRDLLWNAPGRVREPKQEPAAGLLSLPKMDENGTIDAAQALIDECFHLALLRLPYWDSLQQMVKEEQLALALYHCSHIPKTSQIEDAEAFIEESYHFLSEWVIVLLDVLATANEALLTSHYFQTFLAASLLVFEPTDNLYPQIISLIKRLPVQEILLTMRFPYTGMMLDLDRWEERLSNFTPVLLRNKPFSISPGRAETFRLFFAHCRVKGEPPKGQLSKLAWDLLDPEMWRDPDMDFVAPSWFLPGGFLCDEDIDCVLKTLPASARRTRAIILAYYRGHIDTDIYTL